MGCLKIFLVKDKKANGFRLALFSLGVSRHVVYGAAFCSKKQATLKVTNYGYIFLTCSHLLNSDLLKLLAGLVDDLKVSLLEGLHLGLLQGLVMSIVVLLCG